MGIEQVYKNIGRNLKSIREKEKLSHEQFSANLGLARDTYYRQETAVSRMSVETLINIVSKLNISVEELVKGENNGSN